MTSPGQATEPFSRSFRSPGRTRRLVIHDDGRVAYAYLHGPDDRIVSDVWLYNRGPAPTDPAWADPVNAPFANPASFVDGTVPLRLPDTADDFAVVWTGEHEAAVLIRDALVGRLAEGLRPGCSIWAAADGPLARILEG
ncbi:MAG: hypothetical protein JSS20_15425 [Proteobacteria bacterium]|nr:hypothetical protein [Pseudomonadota bacterium]